MAIDGLGPTLDTVSTLVLVPPTRIQEAIGAAPGRGNLETENLSQSLEIGRGWGTRASRPRKDPPHGSGASAAGQSTTASEANLAGVSNSVHSLTIPAPAQCSALRRQRTDSRIVVVALISFVLVNVDSH